MNRSSSRLAVAAMSLAAAFSVFSATVAAPAASAAPAAVVDAGGAIAAPERTSISLHGVTGQQATANAHESRPGLSLVKLYIADWVFKHGTADQRSQATQMIRTSDDGIATRLYAAHPQSIRETAAVYGLGGTAAGATWDSSRTSAADVAAFVDSKRRTNPADPVLAAMASASSVAADGYPQDYGTAQVPGAIGTKWGWSDDRASVHASVSFGADFTVAAITYGTRDQHTADVRAAMSGTAPSSPLPGIPGLPALPDLSQLPGSADIPGLDVPGVEIPEAIADLPLPPGVF